MSRALLVIATLLAGMAWGCTYPSDPVDVIGFYEFEGNMLGVQFDLELLMINIDGSYFQVHGSLRTGEITSNVGTWEFTDERQEIYFRHLEYWGSDWNQDVPDTRDRGTPIESSVSRTALLLNPDIPQYFVKKQPLLPRFDRSRDKP